jgi:protein gp37
MSNSIPASLTKYDAARRALAAAVSVDEVKEIRDKALAMKVYAEQAKDRQLIQHAHELQLRAERRAGELLHELEKNKGGAERGVGRRGVNNAVAPNDRILPAKLSDLGITKTQSSRWQRLAALSKEDFEQKVVAETFAATDAAKAKVIRSIPAVPGSEEVDAAIADEVEITLAQWKSMSAAEQSKCLDPANFPSDVRFNSNTYGIDWAKNSNNTIVGCKHPCEILCWAHDITARFPGHYPHGFNPVFRPRRLNAPRNTPVPPEAATDVRFKNVFSNSMSDMFGGWIPAPWIETTLIVERADPRWNFLHLTKFPQRLIKFDLPPNGWFGTTVDWQVRVPNAEDAFAKLRERYPDLIFFLSIEPMFEQLKFTQLNLFNFIIIGGAARSMRTPEWRPPHRWIMDLIEQADRASTSSHRIGVFEKTNLHGNRILELPFDAPIKHEYPQVAPDVFHYLRKKQD